VSTMLGETTWCFGCEALQTMQTERIRTFARHDFAQGDENVATVVTTRTRKQNINEACKRSVVDWIVLTMQQAKKLRQKLDCVSQSALDKFFVVDEQLSNWSEQPHKRKLNFVKVSERIKWQE